MNVFNLIFALFLLLVIFFAFKFFQVRDLNEKVKSEDFESARNVVKKLDAKIEEFLEEENEEESL